MCSMPMLRRIISGVTPALSLFGGAHLSMRRRRRMTGERLRITEVDDPLDE